GLSTTETVTFRANCLRMQEPIETPWNSGTASRFACRNWTKGSGLKSWRFVPRRPVFRRLIPEDAEFGGRNRLRRTPALWRYPKKWLTSIPTADRRSQTCSAELAAEPSVHRDVFGECKPRTGRTAAQRCLFSAGNLVSIGLFGLARIWSSAQ